LRYIAIVILVILFLPMAGISSVSQVGRAFPMGISTFSLASATDTPFVEGVINVSYLSLGDDLLSGGTYLGSGNASLQLNAIIDGKFWAQDVALFHQLSANTFQVTMVINFWNFSGPVTFKGNTSTYQGLGVLCYVGPTFTLQTPFSLALYMNSTGRLSFGYELHGVKTVFYSLPSVGQFLIGGISLVGVPNDLEFVWGGPGGGSIVQMSVTAQSNLYYLNGGQMVKPPIAFSTGFDTAEAAEGVYVSANLSQPFNPVTLQSPGPDDQAILWPVPPTMNLNYSSHSAIVSLSLNGRPLPYQEVELETITITGPKVVSTAYTSNQGVVLFNGVNNSLFVTVFPGNFTLAPTFAVSSPGLSSFFQSLTNAYHDLSSFLSSYNYKHALSSFFKGARYRQPSYSPLELITLYVGALAVGVVLAVVVRERRD